MKIIFQRLRETKLKLKESKCSFLKAHLQYLGHLISGQGIEPVPEKLESMQEMPSTNNTKGSKTISGIGRLL